MKTIELNGHEFVIKNLNVQYDAYLYSDDYMLSQVYDSWSTAKQKAYDYCLNLARECDYLSYAIVSHNCFMFTFGFTFVCNEHIWYAHITKEYDYVMRLD